MPNIFNSVKLSFPSKSSFDLSHDVKMSCKFGQLVPTMVIDTVPGDKFKISCDSIVRLAPLSSPVFHRMDARMEYFFVPNRLLWPNWEKFITNGGDAPLDDPLPSVPTISILANGSNFTGLQDYMGVPPPPVAATTAEVVNAMPFAAYQFIYNEYYRDQNLVDKVPYALVDGDNLANYAELTELRNRAWEHDYFTSALPFAQRGAPVALPVGTIVDQEVFRNESAITSPGVTVPSTSVVGGAPEPFDIANLATAEPSVAAGSLYIDNSTGTAATTINDLRRAVKLQEWLEKMARGGSRMIEAIKVFFGVKSSDQRLDRPEYIYGTKSPVIISEVLTTGATTDHPVGNMAGHGISVINGNYGSYYCEEHGYIIGIMSVMPKTAYMQGIPKHFLKFNNPFEWYWPQFENIGEQTIENKEIYAYLATGSDTFGYIPRYAEYKFCNNRVAGEFRTSLSFWTMVRKFAGLPALNQEFIEVDPLSTNINDIFAVIDPAVEKLYIHILHKVQAIRPMSKYGTPMF